MNDEIALHSAWVNHQGREFTVVELTVSHVKLRPVSRPGVVEPPHAVPRATLLSNYKRAE